MRYPSYMRRHKKAASVREPVSLYEAKTHLSELVEQDRKSTRLNSSHSQISYAVFCLKKKNDTNKFRESSAGNLHSRNSARPPRIPHKCLDCNSLPPVRGSSPVDSVALPLPRTSQSR